MSGHRPWSEIKHKRDDEPVQLNVHLTYIATRPEIDQILSALRATNPEFLDPDVFE